MKYDDILDLPHYVSRKRPKMPLNDRAAQFAPFAALRGYKEAIRENARQTEEKRRLAEDTLELLDRKLQYIAAKLQEKPNICVTYFVPDDKKSGGKYQKKTNRVKWIDRKGRKIIMSDSVAIPIDDIIDIEML